MSLLNSLKSATAKHPAPVSPIARRSDMLITKLNEQGAYAQAQQDFGVYANAHAYRERLNVQERKSVEMPNLATPASTADTLTCALACHREI